MKKKGKLIVIEGLDGSGKGTLSEMLRTELLGRGLFVRKISFPAYDSPGAVPVKLYLDGGLGERPEDTGAYAASLLYAVDRYISYRTDWGKTLEEENAVIIADRYTTSNAIHQLSKLPKAEWEDFLSWLFDTEYRRLALPEPDLTVFVEMPPAIARRLIARRAEQEGRTTDIHEKDPSHLERAYEAALYAADRLGWATLQNFEGNSPRPPEESLAELLRICGFA